VGCIIAVVYTSLAWVRKIEKFSFAFVLGSTLIFISTIIITGFCIQMIATRE